jgi:hypothetical protein
MRIMSIPGALLLIGLSAAGASAQVQPGLNELGVRGYYDVGRYSSEDDSLGYFELSSFYGFFLTDRIEVGPSINVTKLEGEDAAGAFTVFADYHLGDTSWSTVPFVEVAVGRGFGEGDLGNPTLFAVGPGIKLFFADGGGAVLVNAFYRRLFYDEELRGYSGRNDVALSAGVAIFFP